MLMWLPMFMRLTLEGMYFLVEKGRNTQNYLTHISRVSIIFVVVALSIAFLLRNKDKKMVTFGYIGALTSITTVLSFSYAYQYVWNYSGFANLYELGNGTVAMDTIMYGKLPIVDYFSAHALGDVWTKILYCVIHNDINGIFVAAIGIHESAWGTSKIAIQKNNLFGYGAYDSNPYNVAYNFSNYSESIDLLARVFVKYYLNPAGTSIYGGEKAVGTYYNGATLNGVNTKYASDKNWANAVFSYMQYLYNKL